jgi:NitT/TauT family transport system permease protein
MTEGLGHELATSFVLNLHAIGLTIVLSLALAYLSVIPFFRPVVTVVSKGRFCGLVGLTFLFTLYFKEGHHFKVGLLVFGMGVFYTTSMASVVASIPTADLDYARTLRMSRWQMVWYVVVRGTLDKAIEMLRQNFAIGWNMLTMVEGLSRAEGGVGALLLNQNKHFNLDAVFAVQLCILLLGMGMDAVIGLAKNLACPYAALATEKG